MKITEIRNILSKIDSQLDGIEFTSDDRNEFSLPLFDISLDHSKSILILCENGIFSSAYALARPMFECFIRASWFQYCASEKQVKKIKDKDRFPYTLGEMIKFIENSTGWPGGLSKIKDTLIDNMHSYTHGGVQIVARRYSDADLVHIPNIEEVNALLRLVALISFLSFSEIIKISKTNGKDKLLDEIFMEIENNLLKINNL